MIWFVVTDSLENYRQRAAVFCGHKFTLERLTRDTCLLLHYTQVTRRLLEAARPWAICHSGGVAAYDTYDVLQHRAYGDCIRHWDIPQIGFCGGGQIMAARFGGSIGPMRMLRDDEIDASPGEMPGLLKEHGMVPVQIVRRDPLFKGLGDTVRVIQLHGWEIKDLGRDLILLASSERCRVQAFVHCSRLLYGTQFHPERATDYYPDGFKLLANFFRLARQFHKQRQAGV